MGCHVPHGAEFTRLTGIDNGHLLDLGREMWAGDEARAVEMLLDAMASNTSNTSISCVQVKIYAEFGMRSDNQAILQGALERADQIERDFALSTEDSHLLTSARAYAAAGMRDVESARIYRELLSLHAGAVNLYLGGLFYDSLLGDLAHAEGDIDGASNHFEHVLRLAKRADLSVGMCLVSERFAVHLLKLNTGDAVARARLFLTNALDVSLSHGFTPLHTRLAELQSRSTGTKVVSAAGLTKREMEVLLLIAAGRSNPEIGEELFITINTVIRHVNNIFSKIGAKNRFEAAAFARENDLTHSEQPESPPPQSLSASINITVSCDAVDQFSRQG